MSIRNLGVALLWAMSCGFALGIGIRSFVVVDTVYVVGLILFAFVAVCLCANDVRRLRYALVVLAAAMACGGGIVRMQNAIFVPDPVLVSQVGSHVIVEGIVSGEPDNRATQVRVPIRLTAMASSTVATSILAVLPAHTDVYYGERVRVSGLLQTPNSFDTVSGRVFNYPGFLATQGILFELDRATLESGDGFEGNFAVASSYRVKEAFVWGLQQSLPEPVAGLAGGITVGDKRALGKDITAEFRTVSLVHIIVLSGYNITIIISALFSVFARTPRWVRFGSGGLVALFFAVMTGFASASLRAALMALIAITGTLTGRIYKPERALILVGAGMVAWNPYVLAFDPGFQLSFLATAGLIAFSPLCANWFVQVPNVAGLREVMVSTVSAQAAVLPLLLHQSGSLSLVAIPANLLVLSVIPPAMLLSVGAALAGLMVPAIAPLIGYPTYVLLSYVLGVAHLLAGVPYAAVTVPMFSAWWLVPIYIVLFGFALKFAQKETTAPRGAVV